MAKFNVSILLAVILISASASQGAVTKAKVVAPATTNGAGAGAAPSSPTSKPQAAAGSAGYSAPPTNAFDPINLAPPAPPAGPQNDCAACINYMQLMSKALGSGASSATKDTIGKAMCDQTVLNAYEGCVKCSSDMTLTVTPTTSADVITDCASYNSKLTAPSDDFSAYKISAATSSNTTQSAPPASTSQPASHSAAAGTSPSVVAAVLISAFIGLMSFA